MSLFRKLFRRRSKDLFKTPVDVFLGNLMRNNQEAERLVRGMDELIESQSEEISNLLAKRQEILVMRDELVTHINSQREYFGIEKLPD